MTNLKLDSKKLGMHWHYYRLRYVVLLALALVGANFLYSATKPQTPASQKVDIILMSGAFNGDATSAWQQNILCQLPADQKEVNITATPMIAGQESMIYQLVAARMTAKEGTIWIMPADMFLTMAQSGAFKALDNDISSFNLPKDIDLSAGKAIDTSDEKKPGLQHIYGIPLDKFTGLTGFLSPTGLVLCFPNYADLNYDNAKIAANYLFSKTEAPTADPTGTVVPKLKVSIAALSFAADKSNDWAKQIVSAVPSSQAVEIAALPYHMGREAFMAQLLAERMTANQFASVSIVPKDIFTALARKGALMPLDSEVANLKLPEGTDLAAGMEATVNAKTPGPAKLYGIPLDQCAGLSDFFRPKDMMLVFPVESGANLDMAKAAANWILSRTAVVQ
jgi:hypothetical protein